MGDIKVSGLGYDTEPDYKNRRFTNKLINLKGLNAGYLSYGKKCNATIVTLATGPILTVVRTWLMT